MTDPNDTGDPSPATSPADAVPELPPIDTITQAMREQTLELAAKLTQHDREKLIFALVKIAEELRG